MLVYDACREVICIELGTCMTSGSVRGCAGIGGIHVHVMSGIHIYMSQQGQSCCIVDLIICGGAERVCM